MFSATSDQKKQESATARGIPTGSVPIPASFKSKPVVVLGTIAVPNSMLANKDDETDEVDDSSALMPSDNVASSLFSLASRVNEAPLDPIRQIPPFPMFLDRRQGASSHTPPVLRRTGRSNMVLCDHAHEKAKRSDYNVKLLLLVNEVQRMQQRLPVAYRHPQAAKKINEYLSLAEAETLDEKSYSASVARIGQERLFVSQFTQTDKLSMIDQMIQEINREFNDYCRERGLQSTIQKFIERMFQMGNCADLFYNLVVEIANFKLQLLKEQSQATVVTGQSGSEWGSASRPRTLFTVSTARRGKSFGEEPSNVSLVSVPSL